VVAQRAPDRPRIKFVFDAASHAMKLPFVILTTVIVLGSAHVGAQSRNEREAVITPTLPRTDRFPLRRRRPR